MADWLWWISGALVLGILEMLSLDLVLVMFAGGALAGGLAAGLGASVPVQIVVACVTAALLLFTLRPWLLRHLRGRQPLVETNTAALVGREAVVMSTVTVEGGRVKLAGEVWSARAEAGTAIGPGTPVRVARIEGATAVVAAVGAGQPPLPGTAAPAH
ncbi:NfeD family protein [Cellulomonas biazotea]|uniref:Membrane protein n=1 Tax=Cellulomonas biazotea TaxID=1709 RepID=A0A402DM52_9CELL|nr:NfeD family protein [Cellulomonas biazotea]GCE75205.1 membrane protein [Cellulomonas biazotea]